MADDDPRLALLAVLVGPALPALDSLFPDEADRFAARASYFLLHHAPGHDVEAGSHVAHVAPLATRSGQHDNRGQDTPYHCFPDNTKAKNLFQLHSPAGRAMEVRAHRATAGVVEIELWQPMHFEVAAGDTFIVTAGCDKLFATCAAKFANAENFRGFPHMPGNDFALSYARTGDTNDGSPVVE